MHRVERACRSILLLAALGVAGCGHQAQSQPGPDAVEQELPCVDVSIASLPISESALYDRVFELTGHRQDELTVERVCKDRDGYLFGAYPTAKRKQFHRGFLLIISADGNVRLANSQ